jgi:HEPN domain-containing protein
MPGPDPLVPVIREWVEKAESDFHNAIQTVAAENTLSMDTVCFHAQQCVEKYLKAMLVLGGVPVPKSHNIRYLIDLLPGAQRPSITAQEQVRLTEYAVMIRYPGWGPVPPAEAQRAVKLARRVRAEVRRKLPKAALRRPKVRWK